MQANGPPLCFGKSWEAGHPECAGGADAAYVNPRDGSHRRDRCGYFSACASRTATNRLQLDRNPELMPASTLVRPPQPPPATPSPQTYKPFDTVVNSVSQLARGTSQALQHRPAPPSQVYQTQGGHPMSSPWLVHPAHASTPQYVPMNYTWPGAQMPSYLSVPEPTEVPLIKRLGFTVLRAMLKAAGHALSNFFDHAPFSKWQPPP